MVAPIAVNQFQSKLNSWWKLFTNRRMLVTLFLGFSSGLPLALTGTTLQAWFTLSGINLVAIGSLSLVGQPYVYKFLWAPLLDRFSPKIFGRRRGWIFIMQILLAITLSIMAFLKPQHLALEMGMLALTIAFFSATQDIAIDAYRVDLLKPEERGLGSAMVTGGYRVAMLVSGGLAMVLAAQIGWRNTYLLMAFFMLAATLITWFGPEPSEKIKSPASLSKAYIEPFLEFLSRRGAYLILAFIIAYKLGDAFTLSLGATFLLRGIGFSLTDVGLIYKTVGLAATMLGVFGGGAWMIRLGLFRSLFIFGILQAVSTLSFMLLAMVGKSYSVMVAAIFLESFCGGLGTVAFLAFLMALCDLRFSATQFALFTAFSAVGRTFIGPIAGVMVEKIGWTQFYFWSFILSVPGLLLLFWLRRYLDFSAAKLGGGPRNIEFQQELSAQSHQRRLKKLILKFLIVVVIFVFAILIIRSIFSAK